VALAPNSTLRITFFWRDAKEATVWKFLSMPAASFAGAVQFAKDVGTLLKEVSGCALWKIHIAYKVAETDKPTARSGAITGNLNMAGIIIFNTETERLYAFNVPAIKLSKLTVPPDRYAGITLNQSDVDVAALIAAMISGIGGIRPVAPWSDGDTNDLNWAGELLDSVAVAYRGYEEY
jgi:hypothetical protein